MQIVWKQIWVLQKGGNRVTTRFQYPSLTWPTKLVWGYKKNALAFLFWTICMHYIFIILNLAQKSLEEWFLECIFNTCTFHAVLVLPILVKISCLINWLIQCVKAQPWDKILCSKASSSNLSYVEDSKRLLKLLSFSWGNPYLKQDFDGKYASEPVIEVRQLLVPAAVGVDWILSCQGYGRADDDLEWHQPWKFKARNLSVF